MVTIDDIKKEKADFKKEFARQQAQLDEIAEELSQSQILKKISANETYMLEEFFMRNGVNATIDWNSQKGWLYRPSKLPMTFEMYGNQWQEVVDGKLGVVANWSLKINLFPCKSALLKWWQFGRKIRFYFAIRKLRKLLLK